MSSSVDLFPDRGSKQGFFYNAYSEHSQRGLSRQGRFGSVAELKQFLSDMEWASFTVATHGVVLEKDCTAVILIDRFLDGGHERWQSLNLIKPSASAKVKKPGVDAIMYKGFTIRAEPWQIADTYEWTVRVSIQRNLGREVHEQYFEAANSYKTLEEAVEQSLDAGRQIVDGRYKGCSVGDL